MKKHILFVVLVTIVLLNLGCKKTLTGPVQDIPGRKDYIWSVDTLNYPYSTIYRVWGSSPTDVWATSAGDWDKSIFHFDGKVWTATGISGMNVPHSVYGFASDNIYIGTGAGGIWKFDGLNWRQIAELTKDGNKQIVFDNIWGESPNDFYAFGAYTDNNGLPNNSVIAHLINNEWVMLKT